MGASMGIRRLSRSVFDSMGYSVSEVADRTKKRDLDIYAAIVTGALPAYENTRGHLRISPGAMLRYALGKDAKVEA